MKSQSFVIFTSLALLFGAVALPVAQSDEEWDRKMAAAVIADAASDGMAESAAGVIAGAITEGACKFSSSSARRMWLISGVAACNLVDTAVVCRESAKMSSLLSAMNTC